MEDSDILACANSADLICYLVISFKTHSGYSNTRQYFEDTRWIFKHSSVHFKTHAGYSNTRQYFLDTPGTQTHFSALV